LFIQEYILRDLKQRGVVLASATELDLDSDPTRVLFRQVMGAIAEYDRHMVVLKLRAARKRMKAATGRCEGRKPYGARPGEQETLERMRAMRADGQTYQSIAANAQPGAGSYASGGSAVVCFGRATDLEACGVKPMSSMG
jgi:DNA invertase Pin-like site-specific DNA recombinase